MARPSKEARWAAVHSEAMERFNEIQQTLRDERVQCLQDRRFASIAGAQWEGPLFQQFQNKPRFEINKIAMALDQIVDDYEANRVDVAFSAKDGSPDDGLASTCSMLYRADEQDSCAEEAYRNAFEEAITGGFGAFRLRAEYEDEDGDYEVDAEEADENDPEAPDRDQRIRIEPIFDADSCVYFDLNAKRQDKSDAEFCFVVIPMTIEAYERKYPDDDLSSWPKSVHQSEYDWLTARVVYTVEYYVIERESGTRHTYRDMLDNEVSHYQAELDEDPDLEPSLLSQGYKKAKEQKVRKKCVHKWYMNGMRVMEDCGRIAGRELPIIPVYGKRWFIDNVERCRGHVRLAKDPQRIKNMQMSKLAEISAYSPIEVPIMTPEMVKGHQNSWADMNTDPKPYMLVNPQTDAAGQITAIGPTAYTKAPNVPPAMAALLQVTDPDIKEVLGNPDQGEKVISHVPGKALEMVTERTDRKSRPYLVNMGKAIRRAGAVWLPMAKDVYTRKGRKMKGLGEKNQRTQIELQKPMIEPGTGKLVVQNDLSRAVFDVVADLGPSSATRKQAVITGIKDLLQSVDDPKAKAILINYVLSQIEGEGMEDIAKWARMELLKMGVGTPTPEEAQALQQAAQNAQPSPADKVALAEADELAAKAEHSKAGIALTQAKTEQTKADTVATLAAIPTDRMKAHVDAAATLAGVDRDHKRVAIDAAKGAHEIATTPTVPAPTPGGS